MGILRSVALGKSRKSAGDLTFYTRIGVACFRQKPALSPGYKATVPQRMQQKVFQFMKRNIDASGVKAFIDNFLDAKAKSGRSETKMNIFYRNFMPHLVAQKAAIYELADNEMVDNSIFLGTSATNSDKLTSGVLGELTLKTAAAASITMDATILDAIIQKANEVCRRRAVHDEQHLLGILWGCRRFRNRLCGSTSNKYCSGIGGRRLHVHHVGSNDGHRCHQKGICCHADCRGYR